MKRQDECARHVRGCACRDSITATPAFAGPPLLCHPFEIGTARSLPWDGTLVARQSGLQVANLVADTETLLTPSTPVLVRMETLRRAALYASTNGQIANQLLSRLLARADASEAGGRPDAHGASGRGLCGGSVSGNREPVGRRLRGACRGRACHARPRRRLSLISRSISARPDDPAIQFAAALIAADKNRAHYTDHAAKARAGAARDPLLARNLSHVQYTVTITAPDQPQPMGNCSRSTTAPVMRALSSDAK